MLETRETPRGLALTLGDALFDSRQALKTSGRETLAKVSGILLAYPELKVRIERQNESAGNSLLRERAEAVRSCLVTDGLPADAVTFAPAGNGTEGEAPAHAPETPGLVMVVFGEPIAVDQSRQAAPASGH